MISEQVKAAYDAWELAFSNRNAKGISCFYSEDALFLPASHDIIRGRHGIENFYASVFANGITDHNMELIEARAYGDVVVSAAKWSAKGKGGDGSTATLGGVVTHVLGKGPDGKLELRLHTFN
ncbi:SgcJ/EcaC family oxidoreductase [Nostoc sp. NIES-2111]